MVQFSGYEMPINYSKGIKYEYNSIRKKVGMFDVSHMGEIKVCGKDAIKFLDNLTVNNVSKMSCGDVQYNLICNEFSMVIC